MRGLDAKRINSKNEKNELRSVLEWHPAANDVGEIFSSLKPINSTLPAFESTVFLYLLGYVYYKTTFISKLVKWI